MRRQSAAFILLLLATGLAFALLPDDYLYSGEKLSDISRVPIAFEGQNYSLVKVKGIDTFLLDRFSTPMNDSGAIKLVLKSYYSIAFYPTPAELNESLDLIRTFNKSRNTKTRFGEAEAMCKQQLGLAMRSCSTAFECTQLASLVCNLYGASGCDVSILAPLILDFSLNTASLDADMSTVELDYSTMNFDSIDAKLSDVQTRISNMRATAKKIRKSELRFPDTGDVCPLCIGVCPSMPYDFTSLDSADGKVAALRTKVEPIAKLEEISQQVRDRTAERINYKRNVALTDTFSAKFNSVQNKKANITSKAIEAQLLVSDPAFEADVSALVKKAKEIQDNINSKNFSTVNRSIDEYEALAGKIEKALVNFTQPYLRAKDGKDNSTATMLKAEWRLDRANRQAVKEFNDMKLRQYQLDSKFLPPMSAAEYSVFTKSYAKLVADANSMMERYPGTRNTIFEVAGAIGKNSVDGVLSIVANLRPVSFTTRQKYTPVIFPVLLLLADFSFVSLAIAVFVGVIVAFKRFFAKKLILAGWTFVLIAFIGVLAVGSVGFYLLLDTASTSAGFNDFFWDVKASNTTAVVVDKTKATAGALTALDSCSASVTEHLRLMNKTVRKYEIASGTCKIGGNVTSKNADACMDEIGDIPVVYLKYSAKNETPQFFVVYQKEALVAGDAAYLERCDIAQVLR